MTRHSVLFIASLSLLAGSFSAKADRHPEAASAAEIQAGAEAPDSTVNVGKVYYGKEYHGKVNTDSTNLYIKGHNLMPPVSPSPCKAIRGNKIEIGNDFNTRVYLDILRKMSDPAPQTAKEPSDSLSVTE